jgi:hypothetical protein
MVENFGGSAIRSWGTQEGAKLRRKYRHRESGLTGANNEIASRKK